MDLSARHLEFRVAIDDIINHQKVQQMNEIYHHTQGISCLDHCIFVSYVSFVLCQKLGLDAKTAARGALLHDLYLTHWSTTDIGRFKRLIVHPQMALDNAKSFGISISLKEEDIIQNHMWPLTITHMPQSRESAIVSFADKVCAIAEKTGVYWLLKTKNQLRLLNVFLEQNALANG